MDQDVEIGDNSDQGDNHGEFTEKQNQDQTDEDSGSDSFSSSLHVSFVKYEILQSWDSSKLLVEVNMLMISWSYMHTSLKFVTFDLVLLLLRVFFHDHIVWNAQIFEAGFSKIGL